MEKYKNYLESKFSIWQTIISILCAVIMLIAIIAEGDTAVDFSELECHYTQLETIRQDITNIYKLQNADINISATGMTVTLRGQKHNLKAFFDENNNYIKAIIIDNRISSNMILSLVVIVIAWGFGILLSYSVLLVFYIPVFIYWIVGYIKKKYRLKKDKKK